MTRFHENISTDHRGLFIDIAKGIILKNKRIDIHPLFVSNLQTHSPKSARKYRKYLNKRIIKTKIEDKVYSFLQITKERKLIPNK